MEPELVLSRVKLLKRKVAEHHGAIIGAGKGLQTELLHRGKTIETARLARKRRGFCSRPSRQSCSRRAPARRR